MADRTHTHTVSPLGKVSVPRASPRLVDYQLPTPQLSIRVRSGPGNLGRKRASWGQQLAAELVGLSSGGFREGEICMSRLLNSGTARHEANRQPGWGFQFLKKAA